MILIGKSKFISLHYLNFDPLIDNICFLSSLYIYRAEFLLWDECKEKYCGYREGYGSGNVRLLK